MNLLALTKEMPEGLPPQIAETVSSASLDPGIAPVDSGPFAKALTLLVQVIQEGEVAGKETSATGLSSNEVQGKGKDDRLGTIKTHQKTSALDSGLVNEDEHMIDLEPAKELSHPPLSVFFQVTTLVHQKETVSPVLMNKESDEDVVLEESPLKRDNIDRLKQSLPDTASGLSTNRDRLGQGFAEQDMPRSLEESSSVEKPGTLAGDVSARHFLTRSESGGEIVSKESTVEESRSDYTKKNPLSERKISLPKSGHLKKGLITEALPSRLSKKLPGQFPEVSQASKNIDMSSVDASGKPSRMEAEQGSSLEQVEGVQKLGQLQKSLKTEPFPVALAAEAFEAETRKMESPDFTIEANNIGGNKQAKEIKTEHTNKASGELSAKFSDAPVLDDHIDASLSAHSQEEHEEQAGFGEGQDHSVFGDELLKVAPLLHSGNREVNATAKETAGTALSPSEKTAILSQVMTQFRALRPGKVERIRLQLHPESLGPLQVEIALQKGALVAHIMTGDPLVKELLDGNQALLRQSLAEQGFEVDGFSVDLGNAEDGFKEREKEGALFNQRSFQRQSHNNNLKDLAFTSRIPGRGRVNLYV